jgi:uncharacterized protein (TIGR00369 family)
MENDLIGKYIAHNQFGKLIGMEFKVISEGHLEYYLTVNKNHLATPLAAHGGLIAALIDGALGVAALSSVCKDDKVVSTVEYKTNFMNPALLNDQLKAVSKVEQKGKRLIIVSCDVFAVNRKDILIAKALGTFNSYDASKAGY